MAVAVSRFGMVDENIQNVHPFFAPKDCANPNTHPPEEFGNRRKRRRISSPTPEALFIKKGSTRLPKETPEEWENQLRAAAYGEHSISIGTLEPPQTLKVEPGIEPVLLSKKDKDTSSLLQVETTKPRLEGHENKTRSAPRKQLTSTAPKIMIAICAGGKLVSPASQGLTPTPTHNVKRKKRDVIHEDDFKPAIVKIKYGSTNESRKLIAQKIQEIISGTTTRVNVEIKNFKPAMISKPTHPFFLGATSRKKEPKVIDRSISDGDLTSSNVAGKQPVDGGPHTVNSVKEVASDPNASSNLATLQHISHSLGKFRPIRCPGAMEPIWPPKEMAHVRSLSHELGVLSAQNIGLRTSCARRKLKYAKVHIAGDKEILHSYSKLLRQQAVHRENSKGKNIDKLGQPRREVMTGSDLQAATRSLLGYRLSALRPVVFQDTPGGSQILEGTTHGALLRLFKDILSSSTAFDRFECETHDWIHKYAPQRAEEVLQQGPEALVLRDWLKSLTITSVRSRSSELYKGYETSLPSKKLNASLKKKKRKRTGELDGFVISSDEETFEMEELACPNMSDAGHHFSGKKSVVRAANTSEPDAERKRAPNAVVISGPHGCGKTAAVYAVARELDFDVFEINSGSRRSGKDILEKVGDMTKNHLVNQACETKGGEFAEGTTNSAELSAPEVGSGCQKNIKPVLQPHTELKKRRGRPRIHGNSLDTNDKLKVKKKAKVKKKGKVEEEDAEEKEKEKERKRKKQTQSQRQSLILLEEVDVLFEEDKQFWSTTLDLILRSKRPIIMTCTDERLLPLDEMVLFALLRFTPPPEPLAIDYLILIASNEGHLLSRKTLSSLLRSKHFDLRASIAELNFFCQMAIGDTKGGLEWMLIQPSSTEGQTKDCTNLRVVSLETYRGNLKIAQQSPERTPFVNKAGNHRCDNWGSWNADEEYCREHGVTPSQSKQSQEPGKLALQRLIAFEKVIDALSASDTHPFSDYRQNDLRPLDPTLPDISEKFRTDFEESSTVLNAELVVDHSGISTLLSLAVETFATQMQYEGVDGAFAALDHDIGTQLISDAAQHVSLKAKITWTEIAATFGSIAGHSTLPLTISSFDGPMSSVVQDLAPYVRSIVYSDIKLEQHRLQLNSLLAQNGRNGKRMRTTRASHAALEGGSKAHTRRERWFPFETNFQLILQSGGVGWQELAWKRTLEEQEMESKQDPIRSSVSPRQEVTIDSLKGLLTP